MLVNKKFNEDDIVSLKLITGEELIAKFINENKESIHISNPLVLTINGNGQIGMIPWLILSQKPEYIVSKTQIMAISQSSEEAIKKYSEASENFKLKV